MDKIQKQRTRKKRFLDFIIAIIIISPCVYYLKELKTKAEQLKNIRQHENHIIDSLSKIKK